MTIKQQLYRSFGAILLILLILLFVDIGSLWKASSASTEASNALDSKTTIELVRSKIMENRLNLNNFLLSGDPRDEDKVNKGFIELGDIMKQSEAKNTNESLHPALIQVESTESSWADNFAKPLLAKRHQVDSGDATVSDLQIFYLQKDPASWLTKSSTVLDQANTDIGKARAQSEAAASFANRVSFVIVVVGTMFAIGFGLFMAVRTAKSITEPLQHLISVAQEIGNSGDLDQNIDIHRNDEIGALATTFNNMVAYLKEMASVSMAVAEGDLAIEVTPRSKRDTLGNAFVRMSHGLQEIVRSTRDATVLRRFPPAPIKLRARPMNPQRSASKPLPPSKKSPARCTR